MTEDYVFEEGEDDLSDKDAVRQVKLSDLFAEGKNSLIIYSFMYGPDQEMPCPACTSMLDGLNGSAVHIRDRINFAVVARAPLPKLREWGGLRGWTKLRLLSSSGNSYNADYFAEDAEGAQWPMINSFRKTDGGVEHLWGSELFFTKLGEGQHPRHADTIWPIWNMFDMTPEGRGTDWFPKLAYD